MSDEQATRPPRARKKRARTKVAGRRGRSASTRVRGGKRPPPRRRKKTVAAIPPPRRGARVALGRAAAWCRARRRPLIAGAVAGAVAVAALLAVGLLLRRFGEAPGPEAPAPVAVSWPAGLDAGEAADLLRDLGLADSPAWMAAYLRSVDAPSCFVPGPHLLSARATPRELVAMLCRTDDRPVAKVTIPEGFHRFAIARRLEGLGVVSAAAFLRATEDRELLHGLGVEPGPIPAVDTAEGYLFPATYRFRVDADPAGLVRALVEETTRRFDGLAARHPDVMARLADQHGWGRREILTLASMVEKEAGVDEERTTIASVFLNRLDHPDFPRKLLQSDPTAVYGCYAMPAEIPSCDGFDGRASGALNRDPLNVYSTYVVEGLPPGPIANAGEGSMRAVLQPDETPFLYFVARGKGRHTFSVTLDEHNAAVRAWRAQRSAIRSE